MPQLDIEILQTIVAVSPESVRLSATATAPCSRAVTGIQKLVQRYIITLATTIGSTRFDAKFGTPFWQMASRGMSRNSASVGNAFRFASADAVDILRTEDTDDSYGTMPDDERIDSATLLDFGVDTASGTLYFTVDIRSAAGETYTYRFPTELTGDSR